MLQFFRPSKPRLLGLDISSSGIKLLEIAKMAQGYQVLSCGNESIPADAGYEKEIKSIEIYADALKRLLKKTKATSKHAAIALSGSHVITKTIQMPRDLSDEELEEQIMVEADRFIPFPLHEVQLDFQRIGPHETDPSSDNILLVASKTENIDARVDILEMAGLIPEVVDIEAHAMERCFKWMCQHDLVPRDPNQLIAIFDIGATITTLSVLQNQQTIYSREQVFGGKQLTELVQQQYQLSFTEAEHQKKQVALPEEYEPNILMPFKESLGQQVNRALQLFFSSTSHNRVDHILLAGGSASIAGLKEFIEQEQQVGTSVANPFLRMELSKKISAHLLIQDAPSFMIACGLALRSF